MLISALVEDCMSLTVANVPVVATALIGVFGSRRSTTPPTTVDNEGQQFSSFRFKSRLTNVIRGGITVTRGVISTQPVAVSQAVEVSKHVETAGTNTTSDFELTSKGSFPKSDQSGAAHYISIGSLQGESLHNTTRPATDEHYISISSARGKGNQILP